MDVTRAPRGLGKLIAGPGLFLTPWLFLWVMRSTLFPMFGETHDFRADWYLHAVYLTTFLFGFAIAKHQPFFDACMKWRVPALIAALIAWAVLMAAYRTDSDLPADLQIAFIRGMYEMQAWCAIVAAIGFAHRYLKGRDGPVRRVLTEAIFPFYLVHQTITVVAAHYLDELRLPLAIEAPLLIGATALGCWLFYDLARRVPVLRLWAGLRSAPLQKRGKGADLIAGEAH